MKLETFTVEFENPPLLIELNRLTAIEWLDMSFDEKDSDSFTYANQVAYSVVDWNGDGKIDPLQLLSDRKLHPIILQLSNAIDSMRYEIPKFAVQDNNTLDLVAEGMRICFKPLTVLEFLDLLSDVRKKNGDISRAMLKCESMSAALLDWNGMGALSAEQLFNDRSLHSAVIGADRALGEFFRFDESPKIKKRMPDDDHDHEQSDISEPSAVGSFKVVIK